MKHRPTTPASASLASRAIIVASAVLLIAASTVGVTVKRVYADEYDDQIAAIQAQIDQYEAQAQTYRNQANDLQQKIAGMNLQIQQIQAQIDISQTKYDQLKAQIKDTEKKITDNKKALGDTLVDIYMNDGVTPLEMLASSKSVGDFLNKQELRNAAKQNLSKTITKIQDLKKQLEKQQSDVTKVLADQKNSQNALDAKRAEQQQILNETQGQQAAYEKLSADQRARQDQIRAEQQAAIAARFSGGGASIIQSGSAPNYPWNDSNCPMWGYYSTMGADGNGGDGYGYGCRQCVSYVAWRMARETGYYPINWGNATDFAARGRAAGYQTGYAPRAGSIAVMHAATAGVSEGHVAWVDAVTNGGSTIVVSQYNYNYGAGYGMFSQMTMSASSFDEYVYVK